MKTHKSISLAILFALSLHPPWASVQNCNAQTNSATEVNLDSPANTDEPISTNAQTNPNLYPARISLVCFTTNANGNLAHQRVITSDFVQECALAVGVTNFRALALAYDRSSNSLQVVNRTNREVLCTPLTFDGGSSLTNSNNTRVLLQNFVFLNSEGVASGLLSATQRLSFARNGELTSFGMRGRIFYSFTNGTGSPTICSGGVAVGSMISQRSNENQNNNNRNNGNQGQGDSGNQGNANNVSTNVAMPGFGTTNINPGFSTTNIVPVFNLTNIVPAFDTNNVNPGFGITNIVPGFGTTNLGSGFGIINPPAFGITNTSPPF